MHRRRHDPRVAVEVGVLERWLQAAEGDVDRRIAFHLHLEALAADRPRWIEVLLSHKPVDPEGDNRRAIDQTLPSEALRRYGSGLDDAHRCVDRRGGHRYLVCRRLMFIELHAERDSQHVNRLAKAEAEEIEHRAGLRLPGLFPKSITSRTTSYGAVDTNVGKLLGTHVTNVARQR